MIKCWDDSSSSDFGNSKNASICRNVKLPAMSAAAGMLAALKNKEASNCRDTSSSTNGSSSNDISTAGTSAAIGC